MNDGVGTYVFGNPVAGIFEKVRQIPDDHDAAQHVMNHLRDCEAKAQFDAPRNRAGHILAFHPGEQVHCGIGHDGVEDPLTPGMNMRVMLFLCLAWSFSQPRLELQAFHV